MCTWYHPASVQARLEKGHHLVRKCLLTNVLFISLTNRLDYVYVRNKYLYCCCLLVTCISQPNLKITSLTGLSHENDSVLDTYILNARKNCSFSLAFKKLGTALHRNTWTASTMARVEKGLNWLPKQKNNNLLAQFYIIGMLLAPSAWIFKWKTMNTNFLSLVKAH